MKIAFKKEWLFKYKFWLMLAVIPLASCAALFVLSGEAAVTAKKVSKEQNASKLAKMPPAGKLYNQEGIDKLKNEAKRLKKEELNVWKSAYDEQASIFRFPRAFADKVHLTDGNFAENVHVFEKKKLSECPADQPNFVYGEVVDFNKEFFKLKVRDAKNKNKIKKMQFQRTPSIKIVKTVNGKDKVLQEIPQLTLGDVLSVFFQVGKYFGDQFTDVERDEYAKYYRTQLPEIIDQVEPYNPAKDEGVVQLADFGYDQVLKLKKWADSDRDSKDPDAPIPPAPGKSFHFMREFKMEGKDRKDESASDDVWIAQEDVWIQNELFRLIRVANDFVSKFERVDDAKTGKKTEAIFRNPFWEVALKLDDNKLHATFTNLQGKRQKLDFKLRILMNDAKNAEPELITLTPGLPLSPKGTPGDTQTHSDRYVFVNGKWVSTKGTPGDAQKLPPISLKKGVKRNGIFSVDQVLTWETAAVRRIDGIYIANSDGVNASGHRFFPFPLVSYPNRWAPLAAAAAPVAVTPPTKDPKAPPDKGPRPLPMGRPDGGAKAKANVNLTPSGQNRDRYTTVPEQLRRVPVAVVLIVEQGQVDRVQTAFNNSRLRFLTTQVLMTHFAGSVRPPSVEPTAPPKDPMKQPGIAQPFPPPLGPTKPMPPVRTQRANDELEANVELVIYGIITIYERIPGRAKNPNPS